MRNVTTRLTPTEQCCEWCRQPVRLCREPSCDDTPVYLGVPSRTGRWVPVHADTLPSGPGVIRDTHARAA
jgi:hypothetical protein